MVVAYASPDIARVAALIGDRARGTILTSLMAGRAFTATELARAARVTKPTASAHLSRLVGGGLVAVERQGRHRYFRLAHPDVGTVLEGLMGVADRVGATRIEPGPSDPGLRKARVCYDHLAGDLGVMVFEGLTKRALIGRVGGKLVLAERGERVFERLGVDLTALGRLRRPLCLACLDWSVRRHHLAGALGAALLGRCFALGWARRQRETRVLHFSAVGERGLRANFG